MQQGWGWGRVRIEINFVDVGWQVGAPFAEQQARALRGGP